MGGSLTVDSEAGRGSRFTLTPPVQPVPTSAAAAVLPLQQIGAMRVLVADDAESRTALVSRCARWAWARRRGRQRGGRLRRAGDRARRGQRAAAGAPFDLLFDWCPDIDGGGVLRALRDLPVRPARVMVISAYGWDSLRASAAAGWRWASCLPIVPEALRRLLAPGSAPVMEPPPADDDAVGARALQACALLVEDNPVNRQARLRFAGALGRAGRGGRAWRGGDRPGVGAGAFDVVLMDLQMPVDTDMRSPARSASAPSGASCRSWR
ncbi:MAG: hypothetical protein U1F21_14155 [Sphaerotilus natans]